MKYLGFDLLALLAFAIFARMAHGGLSPLAVLDTWWPFALGAVLAYLLTRAQGAGLIRQGVIIWVITVVTGLAIWGIRHGQFPHWSFILVASVTSGILLLGWRAIRAFTIGKQDTI